MAGKAKHSTDLPASWQILFLYSNLKLKNAPQRAQSHFLSISSPASALQSQRGHQCWHLLSRDVLGPRQEKFWCCDLPAHSTEAGQAHVAQEDLHLHSELTWQMK